MPRPHPMTSEESERDVELRHLVFIKHVININGANAKAYDFIHVSSNHNFEHESINLN
jgi:hypothetical protein